MNEPGHVRGSFFRPNLRLSAYRKGGTTTRGPRRPARGAAQGRARAIVKLVARGAGRAASSTPYRARRARRLADVLRERGVRAAAYHAGMEPTARSARPGRVRARRDRRRDRHHRLRHGHRQIERPLRDPPRHAAIDRELLPGDRPRGPRRRCPATACCSTRGPTCSRAIASPPSSSPTRRRASRSTSGACTGSRRRTSAVTARSGAIWARRWRPARRRATCAPASTCCGTAAAWPTARRRRDGRMAGRRRGRIAARRSTSLCAPQGPTQGARGGAPCPRLRRVQRRDPAEDRGAAPAIGPGAARRPGYRPREAGALWPRAAGGRGGRAGIVAAGA